MKIFASYSVRVWKLESSGQVLFWQIGEGNQNPTNSEKKIN
jgi:hypothetical protein